MITTTKNAIRPETCFVTIDQHDDNGVLYDAFTIERTDFDDEGGYQPGTTTWYEDIVLGWVAGTPEHHTIEVYTIGELPEDFEAYDIEEMSDAERIELADRACACLGNPHSDELADRAGLVHLGCAACAYNDNEETLRNIVSLLDVIEYDNTISF